MYCNEITKDNEKDIKGDEEKKLDFLREKQKEYLKVRYAEEIAHCIMLWFKYYRYENTTYDLLANSYLYSIFSLTSKEKLSIFNLSKKILTQKYKINIISENPLLLSSNVPFDKIIEQ